MLDVNSSVRTKHEAVTLPIWLEALVGVESALLRISPVYWGYGTPPGDGAAVVVIPGFMMNDLYLADMRGWLGRLGYQSYASGIGVNAECPNLLIREHLAETIAKARRETGNRKVHLVGHSLGGVIARAAAAQMPEKIASVVTLGSPFQRVAAHGSVLRLAEWVRSSIHERNGAAVLPECYTAACTCAFIESLASKFPSSVGQSAIYTKTDGVVDWKVCGTGDAEIDCEVFATHLGLVFNPLVYRVIAERLARYQDSSCCKKRNRPRRSH
jgi:triacylglycerol lipase